MIIRVENADGIGVNVDVDTVMAVEEVDGLTSILHIGKIGVAMKGGMKYWEGVLKNAGAKKVRLIPLKKG